MAIDEIKHQNPKKIIVAVPVAPHEVIEQIRKRVDDTIVLLVPSNYLGAVGNYYESFPQVEDKEVINILSKN